jgi:hypothetical protein
MEPAKHPPTQDRESGDTGATFWSEADPAARDDEPDLVIRSDLSPEFPISIAELEAIEAYLADVLDRVLK